MPWSRSNPMSRGRTALSGRPPAARRLEDDEGAALDRNRMHEIPLASSATIADGVTRRRTHRPERIDQAMPAKPFRARLLSIDRDLGEIQGEIEQVVEGDAPLWKGHFEWQGSPGLLMGARDLRLN